MIQSRTTAQPCPTPPIPPIWRRVWRCCAATLVLLLLLQPLLCVAHCVIDARATVDAAIDGPFLCHLSTPQGADSPIIPAFWPGVLPSLAIIAIAFARWFRLSAAGPPHLTRHTWAPPIPPPRISCAA
ncbi:hypothetical protein K2Z83_18055 [Oscillochloris sp. ZM17-4]|uniref:hypothetical protein n=1 Tax=Oscillochloris sp. ZM17-4 TaxID=2866714 RepID=UPI001C73E0DF|nr:hypothetical protein [Oscillochloris sp. ZM17-4]MBX0329576.1 hypothetical protein [Oscillochloris sp. ZM17-4]